LFSIPNMTTKVSGTSKGMGEGSSGSKGGAAEKKNKKKN